MICPYCNKKASWVENKEIYGRNYGKSYMCYLCKNCDAYVGCHNNTKRALGTMANRELRDLRKEAHKSIDWVWKDKHISRGDLYKTLKTYFNKEIHIGESDERQCRQVINFARQHLNFKK